MKYRYLCALLFLPWLALAATPPEKPNTVLIHPGEVLYAQFEESAGGLKLMSASKEKNDHAQLILTMKPFDREAELLMFSIDNKFKKTLYYAAEMRLLSRNRRKDTTVVPVGAGLSSFESWPHPIEELALYGFELK